MQVSMNNQQRQHSNSGISSAPAAVARKAPLVQWVNVGLRGVMELMIIAGLGYWGYTAGSTEVAKVLLAIAAPLIGFGIWGTVDFRNAGRAAEPLRLAEELVISFAAAAAWFGSRSDRPSLGAGVRFTGASRPRLSAGKDALEGPGEVTRLTVGYRYRGQ